MDLTLDKKHVKCHICNEVKCIDIDTYLLPDENGNSDYDQIRCLECDVDEGLGALLGFRKDVFWLNIEYGTD